MNPSPEARSSTQPPPEYSDIRGHRVRHVIRRGTGDAVVLVHGFGSNLDTWALNWGALATRDRTVAALDLPAHGESSRQLDSGSLEELTSIVLAYMDTMGIASAHMVGHSMGAAICLLLADQAAPRVKSLTLLAPAGLGQTINRDFIMGFIAAGNREQVLPLLHLLFANEGFVTPQLVEDTLRYKRLEAVNEALARIAGSRFRGTSSGGQLRDVVGRVPTLIIWGAQDAIMPPPDPAAFAGDNVQFRVLPGFGHMVQVEAAAEVNRLIDAFLG
jgi:pyruvate dehydrogenase E2 component (dihydrolipoamide acetyltransferase)